MPDMFNGFEIPQDNVATESRGAAVLTDEKSFHEDLQTANRDIIIQLNQPYYISSLLIPFFQGGKKTGFCVSTSLDNTNWNMAVQKRYNDDLDTSSVYQFTQLLVVFVKIITGVGVKWCNYKFGMQKC